jgi:excisionase family DNA binding protein
MQNNPLSFDQLPAAVYQLCHEVNEIKRLLIEQPQGAIPANDDKPLSVVEAAEFLGISKQTVYQNIDRLPHKKRFGRLYFFRSQLSAYLNAGEGVPSE